MTTILICLGFFAGFSLGLLVTLLVSSMWIKSLRQDHMEETINEIMGGADSACEDDGDEVDALRNSDEDEDEDRSSDWWKKQ